MNESKLVNDYEQAKKTAESVGITLLAEGGNFAIKDAPKSTGQICFDTLNDMEIFIYGYRLGYEAGLENDQR